MRIEFKPCLLSILILLWASSWSVCLAQRGVPASRGTGFTLFGDVEVDGAESGEAKPLTFDLLLYTRTGVLIDRQKVGNKGRYRFLNVPQGEYDLVFEFENTEVARTQVRLIGIPTDFRQDIGLEWRANPLAAKPARSAVVSADDVYDRRSPNKDRFERARDAFDRREYEKAASLLREIVTDDPQDFQAWAELGTVYLAQKNLSEAEEAYLHATEVRPKFFLALLNLGRVRLTQKLYDSAITALEQAVAVQPKSADGNYFLGEAYLQIKKGSKAVGYLNQAILLDPQGMAEVHLRLAALYHGAGLKDKAAAEYERFLKERPDYPDKKKLEKYITENKKP
jgi:tetratricopeptide (TPR) repeat protein